MSLCSLLAAFVLLLGCSIFQSRVIRRLSAELRQSEARAQRNFEAAHAAMTEWVALARLVGPTHPNVQRVALLLAQIEAEELMLKARISAAARPSRRWRLHA